MLAVALAGTLAATGALAQSKPVDKASQKFISSAIQGDIAEVDFGKLAQEKGQSDAVKQYGAMLVKDHGDHKTKAEQVASELGVTPPTGSGIGAKATYAKLKILSGASFDRSFAKSMVKDHKRTSRKTVFALRRVGGLISVDPDDARCLSPQPGVIFCV